MKRYGKLYEQIISINNLKLADEKARKGKRNTYGVRRHDSNRDENIIKLHQQLKYKTFRTSEYDIFTVYEPKERLISRLPYYPDRIVHHAIMNVLEPIWVKTFTYNTYACVKKRGIEGCARRVDKIIRDYKNKTIYCLKIDITKFYPSIDHNILKSIIRRKIKDKDLLWLLDEIIDSAPGLPIGNYLSQYLANLYLAYFMHWVNECIPYDIQATEYADDIVFFADNKETLHKVFALIKDYFESKLKLRIKDNHQIFPIAKNRYDRKGRALDYVGYKFYSEQKLIRKSIKKNLLRKVLSIRDLEYKEFKQAISPWLGWAQHSNSNNLIKKVYESRRQRKTAGL